MRLPPLLICLVLLGARAMAAEGEAELALVPTVVSGTFRPFTLLVDGKAVGKAPPISELRLNGNLLPPKKDKKRAFFKRAEEDLLEFIAVDAKTGEERSWTVALPTAALVEMTAEGLKLELAGSVKGVKIDGARIAMKGKVAAWRFPEEMNEKKIHIVELEAPAGRPGRLYNLRLAPVQGGRKIAQTGAIPGERDPFEPWHFRLAHIGAFQKSGGRSFSTQFLWTPGYRLAEEWAITFLAGVTNFNTATSSRKFIMSEYALLAQFRDSEMLLEAGGGAQIWHTFGGAKPMVQLSLGYEPGGRLLDVIDLFFAGYTMYLSTPSATHEAKVGIGVAL